MKRRTLSLGVVAILAAIAIAIAPRMAANNHLGTDLATSRTVGAVPMADA